jgi:hypothetical protein
MQLAEGGKIVLLCVVASVVYGVAHDMVTAHISIEYFTVYHPRLIGSESPWAMALLWGVIATWWMGAALGLALAFAAQAGAAPRLGWRALVGPVAFLLAVSAACAAAAGFVGYHAGGFVIDFLQPQPRHPMQTISVLFAHNASYFVGFLGGLGLAGWTLRRRANARR